MSSPAGQPAPPASPFPSASARSAGAALRPGAPRRDACLVVSPRGVPAPAMLIESLGRRPVDVALRDDPLGALAAACVMQRESALPPASGAGGMSSRANLLILCDPHRLQEVGELVEMLRRYAPRVALWWFDGRQSPNLRAVTSEDVAGWTIAEGQAMPLDWGDSSPPGHPSDETVRNPVTPVNRLPAPTAASTTRPAPTGGAPALRLVDGADDADAPAGRASGPAMLTPEELAMLLGDTRPGPSPRGAAS